MQAWQPILTPVWVIITFLTVGVAFVGIGVGLLVVSNGVVEMVTQYDGDGSTAPLCKIQNGSAPATCVIEFKPQVDMKAPVYVYYQLDNFYQNHRRYVKSRSDSQLAGTIYTSSSSISSDCDPKSTNANGQILDPCGLIANSFFNGTKGGERERDGRGRSWVPSLQYCCGHSVGRLPLTDCWCSNA